MAESAGVSIKHLHRLCRNQMAEAFGGAYAHLPWAAIYASPRLERYNGLSSVNVQGSPAPGVSSGVAMAEVEKMVAQLPPEGRAGSGPRSCLHPCVGREGPTEREHARLGRHRRAIPAGRVVGVSLKKGCGVCPQVNVER